MGQISSNIGLVTGLNIKQTVDQLIALQGASRDALLARNKAFSDQRTAFTQLTALAIGLQVTTTQFGNASLFSQRNVTSSDSTALTASVTGNPIRGEYSFTPLQLATAHQLQSSRFASKTTALGAGTFSFRFGGYVDPALELDALNGGDGFIPGSIRVTDRSGASAEIDLTSARNIDDVLRIVNENSQVRVTLTARGDRLRLTDDAGSTTSNLKIEEVNGGTSAASLGLTGINVAANQADGSDIVSLFGDLSLLQLNDGNGVRFDSALADLKVTFRDGTETNVDFRKVGVVGTKARATTDAANGINAQVTITAVNAGSDYEGVNVQFVNDNTITRGEETVSYDEQNKLLTFRIDAGNTTAHDAVLALAANEDVAELFLASSPPNSDGTGIIDLADAAVTTGPPATATTPGTLSGNALIAFTAVQGGGNFDGVTVQFVDNALITAGNETVAYDDSNPSDKKLIFQIDAGQTTAANIISALNNDPTASQIFTAANATGSTGDGLVSVADTVVTSGGAIVEPVPAGAESTLQEILDVLNSVAPTKLHAEIDSDGDRIKLTDLTADTGGTFTVSNLFGSHAKEDLGLSTTASGGTLSGRRIFAGLKTTLAKSLQGGSDTSSLGLLSLTARNGATANVNLASADTLDDVITAINAAGLGLTASVNSARNGLLLTDTTGSTASNLIIANGDASNTATRLGLTANVAATTKNSGDVHRRFISENTRLSSYNGGGGVAIGSFKITDTLGATATVSLTNADETIGDVIDAINHAGLALQARVNDNGDGIWLVDTGLGGAELKVAAASGTTAADLHLLGSVQTVTLGGQPTKVIDGATTSVITLDADDTLQSLTDTINGLSAGVRAGIFSDGSSVRPYRFTLTSLQSGRAGEILFDTSAVDFTLSQLTRAKDALLVVGDASSGIVASSSKNTFAEVVPGLTLTVRGASASPVTLSVDTTHDNLKSTLRAFVDAHNRLRTKINEFTSFNADNNKSAVLQGDGTILRLQNDLANLVSGRIFGAGSIQSIETLGISLNDDGTLSLNETKLDTAIDGNPGGVESFLTTADNGLSARFKRLLDQVSGVGNSLLVSRAQALERKITDTGERIITWNARLEILRARLTKQFTDSEVAIQKIQSNLSAINSVAQLASYISSGNSG